MLLKNCSSSMLLMAERMTFRGKQHIYSRQKGSSEAVRPFNPARGGPVYVLPFRELYILCTLTHKHVLFLLHFVKIFWKVWQLTEHLGIMAGVIKLPKGNGTEMVGENFRFSPGNQLAPLYHGRKGSQNKSEPFRPSLVWCGLERYLELPGILSQKNKAGEGKLVLPSSWRPDLVMAGQ